jgi:hypothetical protein
LGCALKQYKRSASIAIAIILVAYFLSILSGLRENLDFLKYFTPFKYFDPAKFLSSATSGAYSSALSGTFLLLSAAIIVVCVLGAYLTYNRRDLYILILNVFQYYTHPCCSLPVGRLQNRLPGKEALCALFFNHSIINDKKKDNHSWMLSSYRCS